MKKAKIHMADGGDIVIELFDKEAPGTEIGRAHV